MNLSKEKKKERAAKANEARGLIFLLHIDKKDLAKLLDVSVRTVYRWVDHGLVPHDDIMEKLRSLAEKRGLRWQGQKSRK
jgi:CI repressor-like protein